MSAGEGLAAPGGRAHGAAGLARVALSGLIVGLMAVVFNVSFAAIVFTGDLAPFLGRGLGLTLVGAAAMAAAGAFAMSYRGVIVQPQDVTTLILSLAAASVAAGWDGTPDALFATVAALIAVAAAATGVATFLFGRLRLGFVARLIPYPVLGGFLAATGFLLAVVALGMMLGRPLTLGSAPALLEAGNLVRWLPWTAVAVLFWALNARLGHALVLPGCIVLASLGFFGALTLAGIGLGEARAMGLLLGPFEEGRLWDGLGPSLLADADWGLVLAQAPSVLAVAGMAILGALLYASALELATGEPVDPDRDLRGVGLANLLASLGGGLVGYHLLGETLFARTLGVTGRAAGLAVAAVALLTLAFGAGYLSVLPVGVFAAVILFLGLDLLVAWLWVERKRLPPRDFALVLGILAVAATVGFLQAIAVGVLATCLQFVVAYARVDVVRLRTTAAALRSSVERGEADLGRLARGGDRVAVYALGGHLFFGTANRLLVELAAVAAAPADRRPVAILLDFRRVTGVDASAAFALEKLHRACLAGGTELVLCAVAGPERARLARLAPASRGAGFRFAESLDAALRAAEERLLAAAPGAGDGAAAPDLLDGLAERHPGMDLSALAVEEAARAGEVVIEQGAPSDSMILLRSGRLLVEHRGADGSVVPLATVLPGALVGEVGFYAGAPRTARVVAETDCRLLRLRREAIDRLGAANPALAADFHHLAGAHLARRFARVNALLRDAVR